MKIFQLKHYLIYFYFPINIYFIFVFISEKSPKQLLFFCKKYEICVEMSGHDVQFGFDGVIIVTLYKKGLLNLQAQWS